MSCLHPSSWLSASCNAQSTPLHGAEPLCVATFSLTHFESSNTEQASRFQEAFPDSLWPHLCHGLDVVQQLLHLITAVVSLPTGLRPLVWELCLFPFLRKVPGTDLSTSNKYKAYFQQIFPINSYYSRFSERACSQHLNYSFK